MSLSELDMERATRAEVLQFLLDHGYIEGDAAAGITQKVIKEGEDGLSERQREVFQRYVVAPLLEVQCKLCPETVPLEELVAVYALEDGLCSWCRQVRTKDD